MGIDTDLGKVCIFLAEKWIDKADRVGDSMVVNKLVGQGLTAPVISIFARQLGLDSQRDHFCNSFKRKT